MKTGFLNPPVTATAQHRAALLAAVAAGEVYRAADGALLREGAPLPVDDVRFLEDLVFFPAGRTAYLNEAGRTSAWLR